MPFTAHTLTKDMDKWLKWGQARYPEAKPKLNIPWQGFRENIYDEVTLMTDDSIVNIHSIAPSVIKANIRRRLIIDTAKQMGITEEKVRSLFNVEMERKLDRLVNKTLKKVNRRYEIDSEQNKELKGQVKEEKRRAEQKIKRREAISNVARMYGPEFKPRHFKSMSYRGITGTYNIKKYYNRVYAFKWF